MENAERDESVYKNPVLGWTFGSDHPANPTHGQTSDLRAALALISWIMKSKLDQRSRLITPVVGPRVSPPGDQQ